jgi:hypothetical protein
VDYQFPVMFTWYCMLVVMVCPCLVCTLWLTNDYRLNGTSCVMASVEKVYWYLFRLSDLYPAADCSDSLDIADCIGTSQFYSYM